MFIDLYKLLEIPPSATPDKIKKAFRAAALRYHPDRNFNDKSPGDKFRQVKFAYETLTNEQRRKAYDHSYVAYYRKYHHQRAAAAPNHTTVNSKVTPQAYLKSLRQLMASTDKLKKNHVNQVTLFAAINRLLPEKVIQSLREHDDIRLNREVCTIMLQCCKKLNHQNTNVIRAKLIKLAGTDNEALKQIYQSTENGLNVYVKLIKTTVGKMTASFAKAIKKVASGTEFIKFKRQTGW